MPTNYGIPAPPRYFLREREPEVSEEPVEEEEEPSKLDWRQFLIPLMRALLPFPEAKDAVLAAFEDVGAEASP